MKYQFVVFLINNPHKNTASSKALVDCEAILLKNEYQSLNIYLAKSLSQLFVNGIKFTYHLLKLVLSVNRNSIIAVQYPVLGFNNYMKWLIALLKKKGVKFICIIHDTESLRTNEPDLFDREISNLNSYDVVIGHSINMNNWLQHHGLEVPYVTLSLFDYLVDENPVAHIKSASGINYKRVAFAGNLEKSKFINYLQDVKGVDFNLYGPGLKNDTYLKINNIKWKGSYSPEEIPEKIDADFGLLWDGDSLTECSGSLGNYLQFNSPHKLSLYIAAKLPVIVPRKSAVALFVTENQIGICIDSLLNLEEQLAEITEIQFKQYQSNILKIREKVVNGIYLSAALNKAEALLSEKSSENK